MSKSTNHPPKDTWNPKQYEKFKNERSEPFFDLLGLVEKVKIDSLVDLGCGSGELTKILVEALQPVHALGTDRSPAMLEKAKILAGGRLHFELNEIEKFRSPGQFDLIFSNAALQWCEGHEAIFKNIHDSLKPEGQIAIQMPMNHDYPTHVLASKVADLEPYRQYFQSRTESVSKSRALLKPEEYASLLYKLGFRQQKVILKVYPHILESRDGVIEWVKGTMLTYYQAALPADVYTEFMKDFRTELFRVLPDEKPFFYPFKRILIWASL